MDKRDLALIFVISSILCIELLILWFLLYFAQLPFFLFVFGVVLKVLSYFFTGVITLLAILLIMSIRPGEPLEVWIEHFKYYVKSLSSSLFFTCITAGICLVLGRAVAFVLSRLWALGPLQEIYRSIKHWIDTQLY